MDRVLVGLIGAQHQGSLSPALQEDAFAAAGTVGHYHLMDARRAGGAQPRAAALGGADGGLRRRQRNLPVQGSGHPAARRGVGRGRQIGAVNTVTIDRTAGRPATTPTASAFAPPSTRRSARDAIAGKPVLLIGAGGAGRAVAFALMRYRRRHAARIHDRDGSRSSQPVAERRCISAPALPADRRPASAARGGRRRQRHADRHDGLSRPVRSHHDARERPSIGSPTSSTRRSRPSSSKAARARGARVMGGAGMCVHQARGRVPPVHRGQAP